MMRGMTVDVMQGYGLHLGFEIPQIVVIPRTGLVISDFVARSLGVLGTDMMFLGINASSSGELEIGQSPSEDVVAGRHLLVVDGVCKSGHTLRAAVEHLGNLGAANVCSAVMINKPNENTADYVPDFIGETLTDGAFYIFPWEIAEHMPLTARMTGAEMRTM